MYLSRIRLDNKKRETYKFLCSQQVAHATIEAAFSDKEKTRKLWRLDYYKGEPYILILSKDKPNFSRFASQFGYSDEGGETKIIKKYLICWLRDRSIDLDYVLTLYIVLVWEKVKEER